MQLSRMRLHSQIRSVPNKAMQTVGRLAATADRQGVRQQDQTGKEVRPCRVCGAEAPSIRTRSTNHACGAGVTNTRRLSTAYEAALRSLGRVLPYNRLQRTAFHAAAELER